MPIVLTHFISGIFVTTLLFLKYRNTIQSRMLWFGFPFLFIIPDIDHLIYWQPSMLASIFPQSLADLVAGIFAPRPPSLLHNWYIPLALFSVGIFLFKIYPKKMHLIFFLFAIAWGTHMLLDGVMLW